MSGKPKGPADRLQVLHGSRCGRRWWRQKRCDGELNDLMPFRVEGLFLLCEESCSPWMVFVAPGSTAPGVGAGGRTDGSFPTQRRLDATGTKVL